MPQAEKYYAGTRCSRLAQRLYGTATFNGNLFVFWKYPTRTWHSHPGGGKLFLRMALEIRDILTQLAVNLDTDAMQRLNAEVDVDHKGLTVATEMRPFFPFLS